MQKGPFKSRLFNRLIFSGAAFLPLVAFSSPPLPAQEPKPPATASAAQAGGSEFKLRLQSNVVVVRVVVRDNKGHAVGGLRKEDFSIRDNDQPQVISSFSVETPEVTGLPGQPSEAAPGAEAAGKPLGLPQPRSVTWPFTLTTCIPP